MLHSQPHTFDGLLFDAEAKGVAFLAALKAMETHVDSQLHHASAEEKEASMEAMCRIWESIGLAEGAFSELKNVEDLRSKCQS